MHDLKIGEHDALAYLGPDSLFGASIYFALFLLLALLLSRGLRAAVHAAMVREGHIDRTTISFLQQFGTALIWVIFLILYAHLIPMLRSMGTALLAGASIASVVIGLAAQSTLGNLVAGIAMTIYRPFRLGDTVQVAAPAGTEIGSVELITLGCTRLRTADSRTVVVPNSLAASQVTINLGTSPPGRRVTVTIRLARTADLDSACREAVEAASEALGNEGQKSCKVSGFEGATASLILSAEVRPEVAAEDARARLLLALSRRFTDQRFHLAGGNLPTLA